MVAYPINTTEGVLIYVQRNGWFIKPPYSLRDRFRDRLASNNRIWISKGTKLLELLKEIRKMKYE